MKPTLLSALPLALLAALQAADEAGPKPNILVILADNLGDMDVQGYTPQRGKISTPNIDKLAAQGMRYTEGRSTPGAAQQTDIQVVRGPRAAVRTRMTQAPKIDYSHLH